MRMKDWFTVPSGAKVTEKMFGRVLFSSVCSVLLCMACLAGTSWAWFTAGIENAGNVIQIAPVTLDTRLHMGSIPVNPNADGSYSLPAGEYQLQVTLDRGEEPQSTAYVLMSVRHTEAKDLLFTFPDGNAPKEQTVTLTVTEGVADVNFRVTWICPANAQAIENGDALVIGQPLSGVTDTPETTTGATESTEETTETTEATEPTEETQPEETTEPTLPATEPESEEPDATESVTPEETTQPQTEETQPLQITIDIP